MTSRPSRSRRSDLSACSGLQLSGEIADNRSVKLTFGRSGVIGKATPEQKAILDRLERGELTPEQAGDALGGHVHSFGMKLGVGESDETSPLEEAFPTAEEAPPLPFGRMLGAAFAGALAIGAALWLFGDVTARTHLFTTALVAIAAFVAVSAVAAPGVAAVLPSGEAMRRIGGRAAFAACIGVLVWGIAVTAGGHWSAFVPGVVFVLLGVGVLLVVLLGREAIYRTRNTRRLIRRRDR